MNQLTLAKNFSSKTTAQIIGEIERSIKPCLSEPIDANLPFGTRRYPQQGFALGGTACTTPLFQEAMLRVANEEDVDVIISRHGSFPEALNPVVWDVAFRLDREPLLLTDLLLYVDGVDDYWLIPSGVGASVRIARDGLHLSTELPFDTWTERCDGLCEAAKRIVKVTRSGLGC